MFVLFYPLPSVVRKFLNIFLKLYVWKSLRMLVDGRKHVLNDTKQLISASINPKMRKPKPVIRARGGRDRTKKKELPHCKTNKILYTDRFGQRVIR